MTSTTTMVSTIMSSPRGNYFKPDSAAYNTIATIECRHEGQKNLLNHKANLVAI